MMRFVRVTMSNDSNVLTFKAKNKAPETITISFGSSQPFTYTLSSGENLNFDTMNTTMATVNNSASDFTTGVLDWNETEVTIND